MCGRVPGAGAHSERNPLSALRMGLSMYQREGPAPLSFIQGPPGRNIALAIGLRAARPRTPLVLLMNADSVTLGTNHLIHAARRNIGLTVLLLRADLTQHEATGTMDRTG